MRKIQGYLFSPGLANRTALQAATTQDLPLETAGRQVTASSQYSQSQN